MRKLRLREARGLVPGNAADGGLRLESYDVSDPKDMFASLKTSELSPKGTLSYVYFPNVHL